MQTSPCTHRYSLAQPSLLSILIQKYRRWSCSFLFLCSAIGISGQLSSLQLLCPHALIWFKPCSWHQAGLSDVANPRASGPVCTLETLGGQWGGGRVQRSPRHIPSPATAAIPLHDSRLSWDQEMACQPYPFWAAKVIPALEASPQEDGRRPRAGGAARLPTLSQPWVGPGHGQRRQALPRVTKAILISGWPSEHRCQVWGSLATTERGSCWETSSFWMPRKSEPILQCL